MEKILSIIFWICIIIYILNKKKDKNNKYYKSNKINPYYNINPDYNISKINNTNYENSNQYIKYIDLSKFHTNGYVMTHTELLFYKELKKITDKLELLIFPQVGLERIINVYDKNYSDRNKIKSRSIDFTIVKNQNCQIICCIELDDYSHNSQKAKEIDEFKNELFKKVKIPLYRIKVTSNYNLEEIENRIKENLIKK